MKKALIKKIARYFLITIMYFGQIHASWEIDPDLHIPNKYWMSYFESDVDYADWAYSVSVEEKNDGSYVIVKTGTLHCSEEVLELARLPENVLYDIFKATRVAQLEN